MPEVSLSDWDDFTRTIPHIHLLQTSAWGELKKAFGWDCRYILDDDRSPHFGAQVLFKKLPLGISIAYIPKGPVFASIEETRDQSSWKVFSSCLNQVCRRKKAIFVLVEPDLWLQEAKEIPAGFQLAEQSIQPRQTITVDLADSEDIILKRMKQKTRYNIRLATKKGVIVSRSDDISAFHRMMMATSKRDAFGIHSLEYYQTTYKLFHPSGHCELFLASYQNEPLAGLMAFAQGKRAWYFYGASSDVNRDYMAPYLVQWQAMRWAKSLGCTEYDLWGIPDESEEVLEEEFSQRKGDLWGVYRFKRGFGGEIKRSAGPWMIVYESVLYSLYRGWLKFKRQSLA